MRSTVIIPQDSFSPYTSFSTLQMPVFLFNSRLTQFRVSAANPGNIRPPDVKENGMSQYHQTRSGYLNIAKVGEDATILPVF